MCSPDELRLTTAKCLQILREPYKQMILPLEKSIDRCEKEYAYSDKLINKGELNDDEKKQLEALNLEFEEAFGKMWTLQVVDQLREKTEAMDEASKARE